MGICEEYSVDSFEGVYVGHSDVGIRVGIKLGCWVLGKGVGMTVGLKVLGVDDGVEVRLWVLGKGVGSAVGLRD